MPKGSIRIRKDHVATSGEETADEATIDLALPTGVELEIDYVGIWSDNDWRRMTVRAYIAEGVYVPLVDGVGTSRYTVSAYPHIKGMFKKITGFVRDPAAGDQISVICIARLI